jgi:hypothetical protein
MAAVGCKQARAEAFSELRFLGTLLQYLGMRVDFGANNWTYLNPIGDFDSACS